MIGKNSRIRKYPPRRCGAQLTVVGDGRGQVLTRVQPAQQPAGPGHQRDRARADGRDDQGTDSGGKKPGHDALPAPGLIDLARAARSAVAPSGYAASGQRAAQQQDPCERHDRIEAATPPSHGLGGVLGESERHHRAHDHAEHDARTGADGQRGRGHPRPPRRHDEDGSHVAGDDEQENGLGEPDGKRPARRPPRWRPGRATAGGAFTDLLDAGLGYRQDQHRRIGAGRYPRHRAGGGRPESRRASSGSPASTSSTVTTSTRATAVAMLPAGPGQAAQVTHAAAAANASDRPARRTSSASRATSRIPPARRPAGSARAAPRPPRPTAPRPSPAARPGPALAAPRPAQPVHGTRGRPATPRPLRALAPARPAGPAGRGGQRPRRGGQPTAVSRYSAAGAGPAPARLPARLDQPRSASRIRIGYSVPDFSPVCPASAYPCCHCDGWAHSAASTDSVCAENANVTPRWSLYIGRDLLSTSGGNTTKADTGPVSTGTTHGRPRHACNDGHPRASIKHALSGPA